MEKEENREQLETTVRDLWKRTGVVYGIEILVVLIICLIRGFDVIWRIKYYLIGHLIGTICSALWVLWIKVNIKKAIELQEGQAKKFMQRNVMLRQGALIGTVLILGFLNAKIAIGLVLGMINLKISVYGENGGQGGLLRFARNDGDRSRGENRPAGTGPGDKFQLTGTGPGRKIDQRGQVPGEESRCRV